LLRIAHGFRRMACGTVAGNPNTCTCRGACASACCCARCRYVHAHHPHYGNSQCFPSDVTYAVAARQGEIDPQTLTTKVVFEKLPQGVYAASVLHDENLTGKMEFDAQGIPQSGYGISNNPDTTQGPPTPEQAVFPVKQPEAAIEIKMVYWQ
jgi:uncharacterized protein (DUF2141 family)